MCKSDIGFRFTCDECVAGMEWIEAYLEDPIFQVSTIGHDSKLYPSTVTHQAIEVIVMFRRRPCSTSSTTGATKSTTVTAASRPSSVTSSPCTSWLLRSS